MIRLNVFSILLVLIAFTFSSCTWDKMEEHVYTEPLTIVPSSYYPVFPGSWWIYEVNDTTIEEATVSATYLPHSYTNSPQNLAGVQSHSDTAFVPFLNGNPIYGYSKIDWVSAPFGNYYVQWPILSEQVGFEFERDWTDKRFGDFSEKVKVTNKFFNGTDSIITLEGHWVFGPNASRKSYQTYIKNVGLSFEIIVDTITSDTIYKKILTNYFVNY